MSLGQRIKNKRKEAGMSVEALAKKLNKNRATVYRYENDNIENLPLVILEPLAKALFTTPGYLMGWEDDMAQVSSSYSVSEDKLLELIEIADQLNEDNIIRLTGYGAKLLELQKDENFIL